MKRTLLAATICLALPAVAAAGRGAEQCSDIRVQFGDRESAVVEEKLTVPGSQPLAIRNEPNGGITLIGSNRSDFAVSLCKVGGGENHASARMRADAVRLVREGTTLTVEGPAGNDWSAFFIVHVPPGAVVSAEAKNGPVAVRDVEGSVTLRVKNGPLSITGSRGVIDAEAKNGPVSLTDSSGDVRLSAVNGPMRVTLDGADWVGKGLDAKTKNGPLSLVVPEGFVSGVVVEASDHSPFRCDDAICGGVRRTLDDDAQRIELGALPTVVRLSTINGPVSIRKR